MHAEIAPTRRSSRDLREDLMNDDFHRIRRLPPYVFAHIDPIKAKLRANGVDIIDLGMGNPDMPTPAHIVEKLQETVKDPRTHRYSSSRGIAGLRKAQASYYGRRFGVKLNPDTQVVATLGSKEGFANMASAITAPGDVVLVPNPTYPIHSFGFVMSGGVVRSMPADPNEDFMRALDRGVRHSIPKPIALVLNYPSNPTAYTATLDFYKEVVAYCRANNIFILSDLAYSEIYFDGEVPPSVLEVPGAVDITVEFTSMSKTYSMPGWRVGFAVGNERLISALARVKSYLDYGAFTPIQVAAAAALNGDDSVISEVRGIYQNRRDVMVESFARAGWRLPSPKATMFVWSPIPDQYAHLGSLEFAKLLIQETGVAVAPGVGFGEYGDQYVRLALVENEQRIRQAARNIKKFLAGNQAGQGNVIPLPTAAGK
jgi:alanine-synthesizing transaminase